MHSHVDEQFIPGVEWLVPSRTAGPEASEVFTFALVYVDLLDVPHQFLLLVVQGAAIDPATAVFAPNVLHLPVFLQGSLGKGQRLGTGYQLLVVRMGVTVVGRRRALGRRGQRRQGGFMGQIQGATREIIQALRLQQAPWLAVGVGQAVLHHHVVDRPWLEASALQLLHALVLQQAVLLVGRESRAAAGHPHALLAAWHRARLGDAAATHPQEVPIDLGLGGHVGRGGPRPVDVGDQRRGRRADDGIEVYPNAVGQRGQRQRSLLGAGGVGPGRRVPGTRVRRVAAFHAEKVGRQGVGDAIAGHGCPRRKANEVP